MKILIITTVLLALLAGAPFVYADGSVQDAVKNFAGGVAKLYGVMTTNQILIYSSCMGYYMKHGKWPSSEADLESPAVAGKLDDKEKSKSDLAGILKTLDLNFTTLPDNSLLIEGRYREDLEKSFETFGLGKCRMSVIVRKTEDGFSISAAEKTKNDKDYFIIPMKGKSRPPEAKQ